MDIHHGVGTACEGWIHIPRPGGVKKGWNRAYAIVCDFKFFLHEPSTDIHSPSPAAAHIFDIRSVFLRLHSPCCENRSIVYHLGTSTSMYPT